MKSPGTERGAISVQPGTPLLPGNDDLAVPAQRPSRFILDDCPGALNVGGAAAAATPTTVTRAEGAGTATAAAVISAAATTSAATTFRAGTARTAVAQRSIVAMVAVRKPTTMRAGSSRSAGALGAATATVAAGTALGPLISPGVANLAAAGTPSAGEICSVAARSATAGSNENPVAQCVAALARVGTATTSVTAAAARHGLYRPYRLR